MKRFALIPALTLGLALLLAVQAHAVAPLGVGRIGVGVHGINHFPIQQDDADNGTLFGLRGRVGVLPGLQLEPSISWINNGDATLPSGGEIEAPSVTMYSLNALYKIGGLGFSTYFTGGLGFSKVDIPNIGEETETTYNVGLGAEIGVGPGAVDVSPRLIIINTESGASRKHIAVVAGFTWYFN